mgnify:CR=1 FL=1
MGSPNDKVTEIINRYQAETNIVLELNDGETRNVLKNPIKLESKQYLKDIALNFVNGKSLIYIYLKINSLIWKDVISAMLFTVPQKKVISHKESILDSYMPKINKNLTIQIHELTTLGDLEYIEPKIKRMQNNFSKRYGFINRKRRDKQEK